MEFAFDDSEIDELLWSHISKSTAPGDFLNYVKQFPRGKYVSDAFDSADQTLLVEPSLSDPNAVPNSAFSELLALAKSGHVVAQFHLAKTYQLGILAPENWAEAEKWYQKAALMGDIRSRYNLAVTYVNEPALGKQNKGIGELEKLAGEGFADALTFLAVCHIRGDGYEEDSSQGVSMLMDAFELGSGKAALDLSECFLRGIHVSENEEEAISWLQKSCDLGHDEAYLYMGRRYRDGGGVAKSQKMAIELLRKASEEGHVEGQRSLGLLLLDDDHELHNSAEGIQWLKRAALMGDAVSQYNLWIAFSHDKEVIHNKKASMYWLQCAAESGIDEAQFQIAEHLSRKEGAADELRAEVISWYSKAAYQGHPFAQYRLGIQLIPKLDGETPELRNAHKWLRLAAIQGLHRGWAIIGDTIRSLPNPSDKDTERALASIKRAAELGDSFGQKLMGGAYLWGEGVEIDYTEAAYWLSLSAEKGNDDAEYLLGQMFVKGLGVQRDPMIAYDYLSRSADSGNADAMYVLGLMSERGDGTNQDPDKAEELMLAAADAGSDEAREWLGRQKPALHLVEEIASTAS